MLRVWFGSADTPTEFEALDPEKECRITLEWLRNICSQALAETNEALNTCYSLAKVQYCQSDSKREDVYRVMISRLCKFKREDA